MSFGAGRSPGAIRGAPDSVVILCVIGFVIVCLLPHATRLQHASLYGDDVIRIADLQTKPLGVLLIRPFNEHVAPFFELVSWTTWQLAGRRVSRSALAFTLMSIGSFLLCVMAVGEVIRRESRSLTTALCAIAVFCLSPVHAECVWWYSASSFVWALFGAALTWLCVLGAIEKDASRGSRTRWWIGAILASAAAPACSTIGQLAGPLGAIRAAQAPGHSGRRRLVALIPLSGTLLYLIVAGGSRYLGLVSTSLHQSSHWGEGLLCCLRAPADILVPGLAGLENADRWLGGGPDLVLSVLMLLAFGFLSWRGPGRPLLVGGLAAMLGGYGITYTVRNAFGAHWLLEVPRYHLFPQFGFILILASVARPWLHRLDARPRSPLLFATALAVVMLLANRSLLNARVQAYCFPDQPETLRALDRLDQVCRAHGITRTQARTALGPIRPNWLRLNSDVLTMLADTVKIPSVSDEQARSTLMASLSIKDREALCGGMDVSDLLRPSDPAEKADAGDVCRLASSAGFTSLGLGQWQAKHGPAFLEFDLDRPANRHSLDPAAWLCVPGSGSADKIEVWWTSRKGDWSQARSVNWHPAGREPHGDRGVPLDRLPHWTSSEFRHIRVLVRSDRPITLETPRLVR